MDGIIELLLPFGQGALRHGHVCPLLLQMGAQRFGVGLGLRSKTEILAILLLASSVERRNSRSARSRLALVSSKALRADSS